MYKIHYVFKILILYWCFWARLPLCSRYQTYQDAAQISRYFSRCLLVQDSFCLQDINHVFYLLMYFSFLIKKGLCYLLLHLVQSNYWLHLPLAYSKFDAMINFSKESVIQMSIQSMPWDVFTSYKGFVLLLQKNQLLELMIWS